MAEKFEGHSSEMKKDSPWLSSEELEGRGDVTVIIESCHHNKTVTFEAGRAEKDVYSLKFKGKEKQLVINATNRKMMAGLFGSDVKEWAGKTVVLHVVDTKMKGEPCRGIRVKGVK
jgi:hypothetical protein